MLNVNVLGSIQLSHCCHHKDTDVKVLTSGHSLMEPLVAPTFLTLNSTQLKPSLQKRIFIKKYIFSYHVTVEKVQFLGG